MAKKRKPDQSDADGPDGGAQRKKGGIVSLLLTPVIVGIVAFTGTYLLPSSKGDIAATPDHEEVVETKISIRDVAVTDFGEMILSLKNNRGTLRIGLAFETPPDGAPVYQFDQQLRDAFTGYLITLSQEDINRPSFLAETRAQLLHRARLVMGEDAVYGILITDILIK